MLKKQIPKIFRFVPEGSMKNWLRRLVLHHRVGIPRELMVNRGDTVVQVGMWRSESARRLAGSVGSNGRLLLVEMSTEAVARIAETLKEMNFTNATIVNVGIWSEPGEIEMVKSDTESANRLETGRLHPEGENANGETSGTAQVETIENICDQHGIDEVDYMEITVNGAELEAIRGMGAMLQRTKRLWVAGLTRDAVTQEPLNVQIAEELRSHGFEVKVSRSSNRTSSVWGKIDGHVYAWRSIEKKSRTSLAFSSR